VGKASHGTLTGANRRQLLSLLACQKPLT
jgi:hypothetical protein